MSAGHTFKADPPAHRPAAAPIVVTHQARLRFAAQVGSHEIILDQRIAGGGEDAGPSPLELLGAALGSCAALYVHRFLVTRGISTEGLRVEVTQVDERNPHRIGLFGMQVFLPEDVPPVYRPMVEAVVRACPVHSTLAHGVAVDIHIETGRAGSREVAEVGDPLTRRAHFSD
jgi:putative redox protein